MRVLLPLLLLALFVTSNGQTLTLFTGTYTGTGSKGIYVNRFDATTGKTEPVSNTDSVVNPSYLAVSKDAEFVYAVNETHGDHPGKISAFRYDKNSGKLAFINSQLTGGDDPCYVSVTANRKWAVVANYTGGSVSVFQIDADGALQPYTQLIQNSGAGADTARQEKAHVHAAVFSPDERFVFTPDLGTDKIMVYRFDPNAEKPLIAADPSYTPVKAGSGPRHLTFHPNKKFAYLVEELTGTATVFSYHNGKLIFVERTSTHPASFTGELGSADIHVSPDGKFLYVSNRGDENNITIFSINPSTGKLRLVGYQPTLGKTPRNFSIDPGGNFLLVANQDTDNIIIFKRDKKSGLLKETSNRLAVPRPVCLQLAR